jgi:murein DD-endopeptidase MepM/ murein hydrolase activator NlpD
VHAGIDFRAKTGTTIAACAPGKAVFAADRIVTGGTVVLEHLPGVYSLYYHLSRISVKQGERVKEGEAVGKAGATGLATGPHLHWEIRVAGVNTDPDAVLSRPLVDDAAIMHIIEEK